MRASLSGVWAGFALCDLRSPISGVRRAQVDRGDQVDLAGMSDSRDGSQNALRLVHARAVVGLDGGEIQLDESRGRDLPGPD